MQATFSLALANGLLRKYRKVPTAAFLAREFNLRSHKTAGITSESARRWLKGLAIPELDKLLVLRSWLDIDLNALGMPSIDSVREKNTKLEGKALAEQNQFTQATQAIDEALQVLMRELKRFKETLPPEDLNS